MSSGTLLKVKFMFSRCFILVRVKIDPELIPKGWAKGKNTYWVGFQVANPLVFEGWDVTHAVTLTVEHGKSGLKPWSFEPSTLLPESLCCPERALFKLCFVGKTVTILGALRFQAVKKINVYKCLNDQRHKK